MAKNNGKNGMGKRAASRARPAGFRRTLSPGWTVLVGIGILLFLGFSSTALQPGSVLEQLRGYLQQPILFLLNGLPIALVLLLLYALVRNIFYSGAIACLLFDVLSYVNLLKIEGRDDPFVPADVALFREGFAAAGEYALHLHIPFLIGIVLSVLLLVVLGVFFKSPRPRWSLRVGMGVLAIVAFLGAMKYLYQNERLYQSLHVPQRYNVTSVFNHLGFNYCFLYNYNLYAVEKPEGYSKNQAAAWQESDKLPEAGKPVGTNVLFVMCEAFSDLSNEAVFAYGEAENPLYLYNQLAQSPRAYAGHIIVPNFGAGTANTEFDVLTGMPTNLLGRNTTSAFRTVRRDINALPRLFAANGYQTYFMHPGDSWFYNRSSVYRHFGITDQVFFDDAFSKADYKGNMVSDESFLRVLKEDFSQRLKAEAPVFAYTVTIQNHQTYGSSKYGFTTPEVPLNIEVSEGAKETLSVYLEGIRDSSKMLMELTQYLDTLEEPTILVFFGDHRPNLGANYGAYAELGLATGENMDAQSAIYINATPVLIWANNAYCNIVDFSESVASLELPESGHISSYYLGAAVCELLGLSGKDGYVDFLNTMRREVPVVSNLNYMLADGTFTNILPEMHAELVKKLNCWEYYRMKDEGLLTFG